MRSYIIAEVGANHNGDFELAKEMTKQAASCGVDCVKFQTFKADTLVTKKSKLANYQAKNGVEDNSQYEMLKKLELSIEQFAELKDLCKELGVDFLSTPFDLDSIDDLEKLGVNVWKIPSGEITNYPFLAKIAKRKEKVIISTGMCTIENINEAISVLEENGTTDITILHCNTQYPTPPVDANMKSILFLQEKFPNYAIGYSDHTLGISAPAIAASFGATIIEKHFTTDNNLPGPDHKASANVEVMTKMVKTVREIETMLGTKDKNISDSEKENIAVARKSIVASKQIKKGDVLSEDNLTVKRPGTGISPMKWKEVIGSLAVTDFDEDDLIIL